MALIFLQAERRERYKTRCVHHFMFFIRLLIRSFIYPFIYLFIYLRLFDFEISFLDFRPFVSILPPPLW